LARLDNYSCDFSSIMDTSQHYQNGMNNHQSNYQSLPLISPAQLQQNQTHTTLPPLQNSQGAMMYHSAPHTPRTPGTPNTPGSANTMGGFPQMRAAQGYQMMGNSYPPPPQQQQQQQPYRTTASMMGPAPTAMSHPQPIAPAPNRLTHQTLRPMPAAGPMHMQYMQNGQGGMMQLQEMEPQPTHVVGSQGRRGILPSAPGRPAVSASTGKNAMIPAKDADGKFPCPHCTKTYLHAKHLKRHLLRREFCVFSSIHMRILIHIRHGGPPLHVCIVPRYLLS
jgi:hypothetical protein